MRQKISTFVQGVFSMTDQPQSIVSNCFETLWHRYDFGNQKLAPKEDRYITWGRHMISNTIVNSI